MPAPVLDVFDCSHTGMKTSVKQSSIKVHKPTSSSVPPGEGGAEQNDVLSSGLRLGGVWMDHFQQRFALEETVGRQREVLQFTAEDRDTLQWERRHWVERFKANAASLSRTELSHLEAQQIIDIVNAEKRALDSKCLSLESQREWLERERMQLKKQIEDNSAAIKLNAMKVNDLDATIRNQIDENRILQGIIYSRDEQIDNLKRRISGKDEELEVLKHSSATKDRQILAIVKERDRLKDENEGIKKKLARSKMPQDAALPEDRVSTPLISKKKAQGPSAAYSLGQSPTDVASLSTPRHTARSIAVDIPSSQEPGFRLDELLQLPTRSGFDLKERSYLSIIHKLQQNLKEAQGKPRSEVVVNTKLLRSACKVPSSANSRQKAPGMGTPLASCGGSSAPGTPAAAHRVARALFNDEQQSPVCSSPLKSPTKMSLRREKNDNEEEDFTVMIR